MCDKRGADEDNRRHRTGREGNLGLPHLEASHTNYCKVKTTVIPKAQQQQHDGNSSTRRSGRELGSLLCPPVPRSCRRAKTQPKKIAIRASSVPRLTCVPGVSLDPPSSVPPLSHNTYVCYNIHISRTSSSSPVATFSRRGFEVTLFIVVILPGACFTFPLLCSAS